MPSSSMPFYCLFFCDLFRDWLFFSGVKSMDAPLYLVALYRDEIPKK